MLNKKELGFDRFENSQPIWMSKDGKIKRFTVRNMYCTGKAESVTLKTIKRLEYKVIQKTLRLSACLINTFSQARERKVHFLSHINKSQKYI